MGAIMRVQRQFLGLAAALAGCIASSAAAQSADEATVVLTTGEPTSGILILDNADPNFRGQLFYEDSLSCLGVAGREVFRTTGFNNCETIGSNHKIGFDAGRGWIWTVENVDRRLRRFDRQGKQLLAVEDVRASALAIDLATGNAWVLASSGTIMGESTIVFSPDGKRLAEYPFSGFDIAYDSKSKSFWIAATRLLKVSADAGKVSVDRVIADFCASSVAVHQSTGKVWVAVRKHPDVAASKSELLAFDNDGTPAVAIPLGDRHPFHVAVNEDSGEVWLTALRRSVMRYSSAGKLQAEHEIEALAAEVDQATRGLWVVTKTGVSRIDVTGKAIERIEFPKPTSQVWIAPFGE